MTKADFCQPANIEELLNAMKEMTEASRIIAGGTDIMVQIYKERPFIDRYISLAKVGELKELREEKDYIYLGSMLTHHTIADNPLINRYFHAFAEATASIGSQQIRNRGTIGGNLVNASLAGDANICFFLFNARIDILDSSGNIKQIPIEDFMLGARKTVLKTGELVRGIILPKPPDNTFSIFHKIGTRSKVTVAKISIALSYTREPGQLPKNFTAYLGAIPPKPVKVEKVAEILSNRVIGDLEKENFYKEIASVIKRQCPDRDYKITASRGLAYDGLNKVIQQNNANSI